MKRDFSLQPFNKPKHYATLAAIVATCLLAVAPASTAAEREPISLELTLADLGFDRTNPPPIPQRPNHPMAVHRDEGPGVQLGEVVLRIPCGRFELRAASELTASIEGVLSDTPGLGENGTDEYWRQSIVAYDLGLAYPMTAGERFHIRPWLGMTVVRFTEDIQREYRSPIFPANAPSTWSHVHARRELLGAGAGSELSWSLSPRLQLAARMVVRWATGSWHIHLKQQLVGLNADGEFVGTRDSEREVSLDATQWMYGGRLGLRYELTPAIHVDGGWRYRSWAHDDAPGTLQGPFAALALSF